MENNLQEIVERAKSLRLELFPVVTGEDAEMEIIHAISDELGEKLHNILDATEKREEIKIALSNMFIAGQILTNKNK